MGQESRRRERSRFLDLIRAGATLRVFLYHATGVVWLSWIAAMPAMFVVSGALYARSLERRPWPELLPVRSRRILLPWAAWSAFVIVLYTAAGQWSRVPGWGVVGFVFPLAPARGAGSGPSDPYYWTWMTLWYVTAYLWCMLVGIPLRQAHRRAPLLTLAALAAPVLLSGVLRAPALGALTINVFFWVLGYSLADRHLDGLRGIRGVVGAAVLGGIGLAYGGAVTGFRVVITEQPFLTLTMGGALVALLLSVRPWLERVAGASVVAYPVELFKQRAMTIYLWHAASVGLVGRLIAHGRLDAANLAGRLGIAAAVTAALVLALGWIEDLAAGRPGRLWPDLSGARTDPPPVPERRQNSGQQRLGAEQHP